MCRTPRTLYAGTGRLNPFSESSPPHP
jgi:hypothetical protein